MLCHMTKMKKKGIYCGPLPILEDNELYLWTLVLVPVCWGERRSENAGHVYKARVVHNGTDRCWQMMTCGMALACLCTHKRRYLIVKHKFLVVLRGELEVQLWNLIMKEGKGFLLVTEVRGSVKWEYFSFFLQGGGVQCYRWRLCCSDASSHLRELNLNHNTPGDSGVNLLSDLLKDPQCEHFSRNILTFERLSNLAALQVQYRSRVSVNDFMLAQDSQ